ncbi:MAG TPA: winged helix-turn-helix domain-containing protein [Pyrinomonadaceae bacterium]|nr:winged helix-turn-helix domain-containing protein [Pyrinomonadaceae bacterium]
MSHSLEDSVSTTPDSLLYEFGPFVLDSHARRLSRNGEAVSLAASEFELLLLLLRNRGRVVEKSEIMAAVWPDVEVEENNLTVRMSSLRRALGETKGYHPYIQTVSGRGYCLITQVKELPAQTRTDSKIKVDHAVNEQAVLPGSTEIRRSRFSFAAVRSKLRLNGVRLYVLLLIPLLIAGVIYAVLRWQRNRESQPSAQSIRMSPVTHTGRAASAGLSPDGKTIAYIERNGELNSLRIQRVGTNNHLEIIAPVKAYLRDPTFSPDGNTLYYSKCDGGCKLHKIPVLGGVETALPLRADCPVVFSPDGKMMAYLRTAIVEGSHAVASLLIANPDGTGEMEINSRNERNAYQGGTPAWSPDGNTIAFSILVNEEGRSFMKVIGIGAADRKETTLTTQRWRYIGDVLWPEDDGLIIQGREAGATPESTMQLWRVPLSGGEPRRITNDLNTYINLGNSSDGRTLLAVQVHWTAGLWIAPSENLSAAAPLTRGTLDRRDGDLGLAIMPDGSVVYPSGLSGNLDLWSVNSDGSGVKQLTDAQHTDIFPAVTPDGRYIVFESNREISHNIWRVDADGRNPIRLTHGSYDCQPVSSPDGKSVIYVSHESGTRIPKLRKVSIDGGESILLTDEFAQYPSISPDGKTIAYHRIDQQRKRWIILIPIEGGATIKEMPIPKNFGSGMQWAPAGDAIAYRESAMGALWKMPIDGTPPTQMMDLRGERLHYFRYSPDGRRLVYASGPILMDVILITNFN